ncbi:MAG: 30S ribosomal protein S1 [Sulfurimonas sp.]|jgi:small subunit ribosomal protein S1|nr:30S ribosomal protein S1 [Sulfurimonadaceae bacterium]
MAFDGEPYEEESFAELFAASEKEQEESKIVEGELVEIQADDNRALISVGDKLEGILSLDEISENGELKFGVGDKIKVMITGYYNERPKISYKKVQEQLKTLEFIESHKEDFEDIVVDGVITKKNRGGYVLEADGVSFFLPRSLALFKDDNVVGKKVKAQVSKIDESNGTIVVSRRKLFNEERKRKKEIVAALMDSDEIIQGVIKKITSYGMFVDVGGIDGLVHYNEISHKGPVNPSKHYKEGDSVEVKILEYDKEKKHLSLSIKAVKADPWIEIENELEEGDRISVVVSNIENYGAFVDLGNDVEGFLHISEISWDKNVKNPSDYITLGQEIDVEVVEINPKTHKLRVSLKTLLPKPFDEFIKKHSEGDVVKGEVVSLTDFGAFVKISEVEGLLHNQDISWNKGAKCKDMLSVGEEVEVKIVRILPDEQKVSLSKKALDESPVELFAKTHKLNSIVNGTIRDIKDFGVFVSLEDGVDALIRNEDLAPLVKEELNISDTIEAAIAFIDAKKDRIRLSVKKLDYLKNQAMLDEINDDQTNSLGDLIKDKFKR